jgi:oligopeptide transport system ATP-binding protein
VSLLDVKNLEVTFRGTVAGESVRAVRGIGFAVERGECVGLVGESGCGKSSVAHAIVGLVEPSGGDVAIDGESWQPGHGVRARFARKAQLVFQDPYGSLNPRMKLGATLKEVLHVHPPESDEGSRGDRVSELLSMVELDPDLAARYPHELSGGQRQRFGIARALAVNPSLLVADEPVSALDVSVQVQILNLLREVVVSRNLGCLFIAHDLAAVRYLCDRVMVMYLGRIVESGSCDAVFANPSHPYTQSLLNAVPDIEKGLRHRGRAPALLEGEVPSAISKIPGCAFHPRCPSKQLICEQEAPPETTVEGDQVSCCHFAKDVRGAFAP